MPNKSSGSERTIPFFSEVSNWIDVLEDIEEDPERARSSAATKVRLIRFSPIQTTVTIFVPQMLFELVNAHARRTLLSSTVADVH